MIAIIDYNAGNLTSVKRALDYLGLPSVISFDPEVLRSAERIIFPGWAMQLRQWPFSESAGSIS